MQKSDLMSAWMAEYIACEKDLHIGPFLARLLNLVPVIAFDSGAAFDQGIAYLIGEIEDQDGEDTSLHLQAMHRDLAKDIPLTLVISSSGGDVDTALSIMATIGYIRSQGRKVNCHIAGTAQSSAFDITQVCDHRTIEPFGGTMTHELQWGTETGSTTEHENNTKFSRKMEVQVYEIISARTGKPVSYYKDKVRGKEWYLDAKESLAEGFVDEIVSLPPLPKSQNATTTGTGRTRKKAAPSPAPVTVTDEAAA